MRRAVVIKVVGDDDIANAVVSGMTANIVRPAREDDQDVRAELEKLQSEYRVLEAKYAVKVYRTGKDFEQKKIELVRKCKISKPRGWRSVILVGWAIICMGFSTMFNKYKTIRL